MRPFQTIAQIIIATSVVNCLLVVPPRSELPVRGMMHSRPIPIITPGDTPHPPPNPNPGGAWPLTLDPPEQQQQLHDSGAGGGPPAVPSPAPTTVMGKFKSIWPSKAEMLSSGLRGIFSGLVATIAYIGQAYSAQAIKKAKNKYVRSFPTLS
jgi:hypothetical protein